MFADEKTRVRVTRKCMGSLMTSLKRDGFSLSLLKASTLWEGCLGEETHLSPKPLLLANTVFLRKSTRPC